MNFHFDQVALEYDAYYATEFGKEIDRLEKRLVEKLLDGIEAGQVLEVGCGTGHWTEFLVGKGYRVLGLDASAKMLDVARARNLPGCEFLFASAEAIPLPDHSVDLVVAIAVFEFIENHNLALAEVHRVLKPGGYFLLGAINEHSAVGRQKHNDPILKPGRLFTTDYLAELLCNFGEPRLEGCVLMRETGMPEDEYPGTHPEDLLQRGAFIAGIAKKIH